MLQSRNSSLEKCLFFVAVNSVLPVASQQNACHKTYIKVGGRLCNSMFRILLLLDTRERALYDCIVGLLAVQKTSSKTLESMELQFKTLELGDIKVVLSKDDTVLREIVIERKTLPDMISSMRDG